MSEQISYTTILHNERKALAITTNEYCLCDKVQKLMVNPESKVPGWSYASREYYADFLGITRRAVIYMIDRLCEMGLLEKNEVTKNLRVTKKWYDAVVVKKLHPDGEKTSPELVKKLHPDGEKTSHNNKRDNKKENIVGVDVPLALQTPTFLEKWNTLISMPKWRKKTATAAAAALRQLSAFDVEFAAAQVECAIAGNWQGVVFTDTPGKYDEWKRKKAQPKAATPAPGKSSLPSNIPVFG